VAEPERYEVKLANGDVELADSLWGARHIVAQRAAFAPDPLRPTTVLPATISKLGKQYFGGRTFVEQLTSVSELSALPSDPP
jgi:hypothetical protein